MKKIISLLLSTMFTLSIFGDSFEKKDFHIEGSTGKLYAILEYPGEVKNDVKYPLVIICHGFNGRCESPLEETLSFDLVDKGMAALRFDFNGHGKSEGLFQDMTVPNEIEDLKCVVNWAKSQPWVGSIALVGHSQGGVVVSMTSGELGDSIISAEVLMAPAAVLREDALRGTTMGSFFDPWNIESDYIELPSFVPGGKPLYLGRNYIQTALTLPIYETARKYNGPALILHGTHDRVVPYTFGERYGYELKKSELNLIEGDDHMFSNTMSETCMTVADWLANVLNPAPVNPVRI